MTNPMQSPRETSGRALCGAKTRNGGTCTNWPIPGGRRCRMHGGSTPAALEKARTRVLEARIKGELVERGWAPVLNPIPVMADLAGETVAFKDLAREKLNELDRWDHHDAKDAEQERAMVAVYSKSLNDAFAMLEKMARLGLDAEALRQALAIEQERPTREQATQMATWLTEMIDVMQATPEQRQAGIAYLAGRAQEVAA